MLFKIYNKLLKEYGLQGWWPLLDYNGINPTKTGSINGYHPGDYSLPKSKSQRFEIIVGAVLTQNTSWPQVEKALQNLKRLDALKPDNILSIEIDKLKEAIRPVGYFNQKAHYIIEITKFFISLKNKAPTREALLSVKGIGNETADSILLYAYSLPEFVVDAYTKRIFLNLGLINEDENYIKIKALFEKNIPSDFKLYQEYHALIVEHAKRYYKKKPYDDKLLGYTKNP